MAVVSGDPLDIALDRLGALISERDHNSESIAGASAIAGLWHQVYAGAMDRNDFPLALLAAREWCVAMRVIRALTGTLSPPV